MSEFLTWSLRDALARSSQRIIDVFRAWDNDGSGTIDKREFHRAVRALGFPVEPEDTDKVFDYLDKDKGGTLEYAELNSTLRDGEGSERAKHNLKRAPKQAKRDASAPLTAKNINVNYVVAHAASLPETVKLDSKSETTLNEQIRDIIKKHEVRLIDLFREWDDDGNGAIDKKELRNAVAALGYAAPAKAIDAFFDGIDDDNNGYIEFHEIKAALSDKGIKQAKITAETKKKKLQKKKSGLKRQNTMAGDVAGTGEEDFDVGNRQNAAERDAADQDSDSKLSFKEFSAFIRAREEGKFTEEELKARFERFDVDQSGKIEMSEFITWSLRDALARSSQRIIDLFRAWDEDASGTIDKREFFRAIHALGFPVEQVDTDKVFNFVDKDRSGTIQYGELNEKLREGEGSEKTKHNLKRAPRQADRSSSAKLTAKNINLNYVVAHAAALPPTKWLDATDGTTFNEQLRNVLMTNSVHLIDLFREWDDDGNGAIDKKEFRHGVAALGYEAPKADIDKLFDSIDEDSHGYIEFHELKQALTAKGVIKAAAAADEAARAAGKALPSTMRRQSSRGGSLPPLEDKLQQLKDFLATHNIKVIELFHEWDEDKSGTLDKSELRRAVKALGFYAEPEDCDAIFDLIDASGDGHIDFDELKRALNQFLKGRLPSPKRMPSSSSHLGTPGRANRLTPLQGGPGDAARVLSSLGRTEDAGELIVQPHGEHTHTVIMLHPEASTAEGVFGRLDRRFNPLTENCKFVFPRCPERAGTSFWFLPPPTKSGELPTMHFYVQPEDPAADAASRAQLEAQSKRLHAIMDREAAMLRGDRSRIILGGTAQGGSVALHAAMSYATPLCALICLRCAPLEKFTAPNPQNAATPVFVFAGGRDSVCPLTHQQDAFERMQGAGYSVEWHIEPGLGHTSESLNEQRYTAYWAAKASAYSSKPFDSAAVKILRSNLVANKEAPSYGSLSWALSPKPYTARAFSMISPPGSPNPFAHGSPSRQSLAHGSPSRQNPMTPLRTPAAFPTPPQTSRPDLGTANGSAAQLSPRSGRSQQKQRLSSTDEAAYLLPGSKTFLKGLKRAYEKGLYIPWDYAVPASPRAGAPHTPRIGVAPLERQPEWRASSALGLD